MPSQVLFKICHKENCSRESQIKDSFLKETFYRWRRKTATKMNVWWKITGKVEGQVWALNVRLNVITFSLDWQSAGGQLPWNRCLSENNSVIRKELRVQLQCRLGAVFSFTTFMWHLPCYWYFLFLFQFIYLFASPTTLLLKTIFLYMHAVMCPSVVWVLDKPYIISTFVFHNLSSWNWLIFFQDLNKFSSKINFTSPEIKKKTSFVFHE